MAPSPFPWPFNPITKQAPPAKKLLRGDLYFARFLPRPGLWSCLMWLTPWRRWSSPSKRGSTAGHPDCFHTLGCLPLSHSCDSFLFASLHTAFHYTTRYSLTPILLLFTRGPLCAPYCSASPGAELKLVARVSADGLQAPLRLPKAGYTSTSLRFSYVRLLSYDSYDPNVP